MDSPPGPRGGAPADGASSAHWLVCPVCGAQVEFESCHTRCPRCHALVESCSDGGRMTGARDAEPAAGP